MKRLALTSVLIGILTLVGCGASAAKPSAPQAEELAADESVIAQKAAETTTETEKAALALVAAPVPVQKEEKKLKCKEGMIEVEGDYCPSLEQKCLKWLDPATKLRCAEFSQESKCYGPTVHKHFCMDKYEYPNKAGEKPMVMGTWHDAVKSCKAQGKRLCKDSEWTLACEGQERLPYPYGHTRDSNACNIDKTRLDVNEAALYSSKDRQAEADRLWQGLPSGSKESCKSSYGVFDMTGNVDEWVVNESGYPYQSGSKGGYWGPVRTRCRPMTTAHYENFAFYQLGFRCCDEVE